MYTIFYLAPLDISFMVCETVARLKYGKHKTIFLQLRVCLDKLEVTINTISSYMQINGLTTNS
jgi:hypothetical protein